MKKSKMLLAVIMATGVVAGCYTNAYAKVSSYILKDSASNKLYQYDIKDIQSNLNNSLFFEFMNNFRNSDKVMIHDDETGKYVNYDVVKKELNEKNNKVDLDEICKNAKGEKEPFYVYHRVIRDGRIENELNFTKNDVDLDFDVFQLKQNGNIRISGNNFNISNLNTENDIIITPYKNGIVTLDNVKAKNIKISGAGDNVVKLNDVQAKNLEVKGNAKVTGEGKFFEIKSSEKCKLELLKNKSSQNESKPQNSNTKTSTTSSSSSNSSSNKEKDTTKPDGVTSASKHGNKTSQNSNTKTSTTSSSSSNSSSNKEKDTTKPDGVTSASKHGNKTSQNSNTKTSTTSSSSSNSSSNKEKDTTKPDGVTSASKHNGESPSKPEKDGEKTNNSTSSHSNHDNSISTNNSESISSIGNNKEILKNTEKGILEVIDKEHTCIMNIHWVNYAVIILEKGNYKDYNFYIDGEKVDVQRVNKEGTIVKVELKDRIDKKLVVEKDGNREEVVLKYKNF